MKRKLSFIAFIALSCLISLVLTSCSIDRNSKLNPITTLPVEEITENDEQRRTFAIVYPVAHPFFEGVTRSAKQTADMLDVEVVIHAPDNVEQQIQIMDHLIKSSVDGIGIGPTDPAALTPFIDKAIQAGIKVICFDTDAPDSKRLSYIGTDNLLAGQHIGEVVAQLLDYEGTVIASSGISTMLNLNTRIEGFKQVIEQYPNIEILDIRYSNGMPANTLSNIEEMVRDYPQFNALIGMDSLSGPAAVTVWKALGLEKIVVTFDDLPAILDGIENGQITSAISQHQTMWGQLIVERLNEALDGKDIPLFEDTETIEINRNNLSQFR